MKKKFLKKILIAAYIYYNLKRPFKKYSIVLVKDDRMMKKLYKLRYDIYCEDVHLLKKENYPEKIEKDEYDDHSIHFAVLNREKEVVGTIRLIKNSELNLPTIDEFDLHKTFNEIPRNGIVEISRFMVRKDFRKTMLMVDLCKTVYLYCKKNNYEYILGCAEKWFIKSLNQLMGPLNIIGEPKFCFNAINYPFLLGVEEAERNVSKISKILLKYFNSVDEKIILE